MLPQSEPKAEGRAYYTDENSEIINSGYGAVGPTVFLAPEKSETQSAHTTDGR